MKENYEENESKFKYVKTRHENCHDIHLHGRVMEDPEVCLNILHTLTMLPHELLEPILRKMCRIDMMFQSLEQLVWLVELDMG